MFSNGIIKIKKNNVEKIITNLNDSYPSYLGELLVEIIKKYPLELIDEIFIKTKIEENLYLKKNLIIKFPNKKIKEEYKWLYFLDLDKEKIKIYKKNQKNINQYSFKNIKRENFCLEKYLKIKYYF